MLANAKIILASGSKFRKILLENAGVFFSVKIPDVDESKIVSSDPQTMAQQRALTKALAIGKEEPDAFVIGADQVLALGTQILHKSENLSEAKAKLKLLSGKTHQLLSAFCLVKADKVLHHEVVVVKMGMRELTEVEIDEYLETGEWRGCVGGYQFENRGYSLFNEIDGETSAIIGLPLPQLLAALELVTSSQ
jgi:septum formation protein